MTYQNENKSPNSEKKRGAGGRPSVYTRQIDLEICSRIAKEQSLRQICDLKHMPSIATVLSWLSKGDLGDEKYREFSERYTRARAASGDLAYATLMDYERRMLLPKWLPNPDYDAAAAREAKKAGQPYDVPTRIENPEYLDPTTGRVVVDSAKWRAAKLKPQVYGEKVEVAHSGSVRHQHLHRLEAPAWLQDRIGQPVDAGPLIEQKPAKAH